MQMVMVNGVRVAYAVSGSGGPIVLVHGWNNDSTTWGKLVSLLERDYRVYVIDLPGSGESDPLTDYTLDSLAEVVGEFCEVLELEQVLFGGVSLGAMVSAAAANLQHDRVVGVIVLGLAFASGWRTIDYALMHWGLRLARVLPGGERMCKGIVTHRWFGMVSMRLMQFYSYDPSLAYYLDNGRLKAQPEAIVGYGLIATGTSVRSLVKGVTQPILWIQGEKDWFVDGRAVKKLATDVSARLVMVPECGHMIHLERPEMIPLALREWHVASE